MHSARGLLPVGHLCWGFADRAEFDARSAEYLADGLAAGQWIVYVGDGDAGSLRREFGRFDGGQQALDAGRAVVCVIDDFQRFTGPGRVVDPEPSVEVQVTAAKKALTDGFTGVRAIVDGTPLARTPEQRESLARLEHLLDRKMSVLPMSALCAYDVSELGPSVVAELSCLHPFVGEGSTQFRLYADEDTGLALAGEMDWVCHELFAATVSRIVSLSEPAENRGVLDLDVGGVTFVDHHALLALDAAARARNTQVVLHSAAPIFRRLTGLLACTNLCLPDGQGAV
ncbi:MAG: MEDS domain-containing protein [Acidimicrobiaceae bacterium]|nr:MEDS domain-containing protein [Acidimicrobiaceae bacterium]